MAEDDPPDSTPLVSIAKVREMGILLTAVGVAEAVITWLGELYFFGLVPAWLLGCLLGLCGIWMILSPSRWQERVSRRLRDVGEGNWSGKR